MAAPAVSLICTVRNECRHVSAALESALAQEDVETEIVVVDDGSTDSTSDILAAIAKDDRVRVLTTGSVGRGRALRLALNAARAPFVANLDADDVAHPRRLALQLPALAGAPEVAVVGSRLVHVGPDATPAWVAVADRPELEDVTRRLVYGNPLPHSSALIRRAALDAVGSYDIQRSGQHDYDLWVRLASAGWRLAVVDASLTGKRWHAGQKFEGRHRMAYLAGSVRVQARAIRTLGAGPGAWGALGTRIAWRLVPHRFRAATKTHP